MKRLLLGIISLSIILGAPAWADDSGDEPGVKAYQLGVKYMKAGRYRKAIVAFEKALPKYENRGDVLWELVRIAAALKLWKKSVLYGEGFLYLEKGAREGDQVKGIIKKAQKALKAKRIKTVPLTVTVNPKGAEVRINSVPLGVSGKGVINLYPGTYRVTCVTGNYYPWTKAVVVTKGEKNIVTGQMKRVIRTGYLQVKTQPAKGVTVYVDNKKVGVTPLGPIKLRTGKHLVRFEKKGWDRWYRYIMIENDQTEELKPVMERTPPGKSPYRIE